MAKKETQYVTVKFDTGHQEYTYANEGTPTSKGSEVLVRGIWDTGVQQVEVTHTSKIPPSKKATPDGYKGRVHSKILRTIK